VERIIFNLEIAGVGWMVIWDHILEVCGWGGLHLETYWDSELLVVTYSFGTFEWSIEGNVNVGQGSWG